MTTTRRALLATLLSAVLPGAVLVGDSPDIAAALLGPDEEIDGQLTVTPAAGHTYDAVHVTAEATGKGLGIVAQGQGAAIVSTSTTSGAHAVSAVLQSPTGHSGDNVSALNVVSENADFSAAQVTGHEAARGTLKVAHVKPADVSDAGSAAVSVALKGAGTAAQGVFITATDGPSTGNAITVRNNAREDLVVKGTGRVGVGIPTGATPGAMLDVRPYDTATPALVLRNSSGQAFTLRVDEATGDLVAKGPNGTTTTIAKA